MATQDDKGSRLSVKKPAELIKIHPTDKQPRGLVHIWPIVLPLKKKNPKIHVFKYYFHHVKIVNVIIIKNRRNKTLSRYVLYVVSYVTRVNYVSRSNSTSSENGGVYIF